MNKRANSVYLESSDSPSARTRNVGVETGYVSAHWRTRARLIPTIVSSVASLATLCGPTARIAYPHDSEWDALRGDWLRIGADMATVTDRLGGRRHGNR